MTERSIHIDKLESISKALNELSYLDKSKIQLKQNAEEFNTMVSQNWETIKFYPSLESEIMLYYDKKNFNISNAHEIIANIKGNVPKLDYVKSSYLSYGNINDTELIDSIRLHDLSKNVKQKIDAVKLIDVDSLYQEIVRIYNLISSSSSKINNVKNKYDKIIGIISQNATVITQFPLIQQSFDKFFSNPVRDEVLADTYLASINAQVIKLTEINNIVLKFSGIAIEKKKIFNPDLAVFFNQLKSKISYNQINSFHAEANSKIQQCDQRLNILSNVKQRFTQVQSLLSAQKQNLYPAEYNNFQKELAQINYSLTSGLDQQFDGNETLLSRLEQNINTSVSRFNTINQQHSNLLATLNANKDSYWKEDYDALKVKIDSFSLGTSNSSFQDIDKLIRNNATVKGAEINAFVTKNDYLLKASNSLNALNLNIRNAFVEKIIFLKFIDKLNKFKLLKLIAYKLKDALILFLRFLIKPTTLKILAIITVIGLAGFFIFSFWKEILIVLVVGGILIALIKK